MSHAKHEAEHENLSALIDGELGRDEIRFLLRRIDGDAAMYAAWEHYHIIGDGLRHETCVLADADFAGQVMQRVDAEDEARASTAPRSLARRRGHHWMRWSAGGAIAAGVAVAALVLVQPGMQPATVPAPGSHAQVAEATAQPATSATKPMTPATVPRWLSASPSAARLAQPAAANVYSGGMPAAEPYGYGQHLSPYMTLPGSRASTTLEARRIMRQLWSMAPRRGLQQAPTSWEQAH